MQVSIIGSGVVGSATGRGFAKMGKQVTFYDTNPRTLAELESEGFLVARSLEEAVKRSQVLVLCLPTPPSPTGYDLSRLYQVAEGIDELIEEHTIVLRSTVLPGTTRELSSILPMEKLVYNPEFLREAYAFDDFLNPNRIVIGAQSETAFRVCDELYSGFRAPIIKTDWETAEMGKLVSNSFLASKISFFNEVWLLSKKKGFDTTKIETIAALDTRIGLYGTKGGTPFHGACLPKDSEALTVFARASGQGMMMLESTLRVNEAVKSYATQPKRLEVAVSVQEKPRTLESNPS